MQLLRWMFPGNLRKTTLCTIVEHLMEARSETVRLQAVVEGLDRLNADTLGVRLACSDIAYYQPGQYIGIYVEHAKLRHYSLASVPGMDDHLVLHVRKGPAGSSSRWFHEELHVGAEVWLTPPQGNSIYPADINDQPMLLVCTGSGLTPHVGIVRAALHRGHVAPIHLYHGVRKAEELYLVDELRCLSRLYPQFNYVPCISGEIASYSQRQGRALDLALRDTPLGAAWRVYLSGNPDMIRDGFDAAMRRGVPLSRIHSDQMPESLRALLL
jgi:ferredoxin-NADP reductase